MTLSCKIGSSWSLDAPKSMACRERRSAGWELGQSSFTVRRVVSGGGPGPTGSAAGGVPWRTDCQGGVWRCVAALGPASSFEFRSWLGVDELGLEPKLPWSWRGREGGEGVPAVWAHAPSCRKGHIQPRFPHSLYILAKSPPTVCCRLAASREGQLGGSWGGCHFCQERARRVGVPQIHPVWDPLPPQRSVTGMSVLKA